jgi:hypothetical protein
MFGILGKQTYRCEGIDRLFEILSLLAVEGWIEPTAHDVFLDRCHHHLGIFATDWIIVFAQGFVKLLTFKPPPDN